ncbi:hypothetical protein N7474_010518 [Penicillium riverlandense]|uniref:uncharacterized protein n=1 Tax=Penicillium riverlandense TaxID=1903569 RepID=UPI00254895D7|nr:uncharacterized protein N7474_010518 [Penicillium riverlandense]KAJ5806926.1 hypothetical protein N7474_010518 [Penicillium riverlandense]
MKTSISSDVWETKKALISRLYMEEEWPLKQVIKQIRSDDFNPSETQLRSRLKKWRVTKPSRQIRNKPQAPTRSKHDPDAKKNNKRRSSPRPKEPQPPSASSTEVSSAPTEWTVNLPVYTQPKLSLPAQPLTPSPSSGQQTRANNSFTDLSSRTSFAGPIPHDSPFNQTSSASEDLMLNTSTCAYPSPGYPLSPDLCLPISSTATAPPGMPWPTRSLSVDFGLNPAVSASTWYSTLGVITPPLCSSHSAAPLSAPIVGQMPVVVPPSPDHGYFPPFTQYPSEMPGFAYDYAEPRTWKRAMSLQYNPMPEMELQHTGPSCVPGFYVSQDHLVQKTSGVGY